MDWFSPFIITLRKEEIQMTEAMIRKYTALVKFLGEALGPCYEVVLQDVSSEKKGIIAIANGQISGREVGAPLTGNAIKMIMSRRYEETDRVINYLGVLKNGHKIRSSTMFLYDDNGKLAGLLCINFDPSPFQEMSVNLMRLIHPDTFIGKYLSSQKENEASQQHLDAAAGMTEYFSADTTALMNDLFSETVAALGVPSARLKQEEKILLIARLYENGLFKLKGSVEYVAEQLGCSQASVYRYLGIVRKNSEKG